MVSPVRIIKSNGIEEFFEPTKLLLSLKRAGAPEPVAEKITQDIAAQIKDGDSTQHIYKKAFALLRKQKMPLAARYSLKRAVFDLGPSGFPFEHFVSELFRAKGYRVSTGEMIRGKCALHEVDLVARKEGDSFGAEIKFHNRLGVKTDLKVALYVFARFEDITSGRSSNTEGDYIRSGALITNTKFTENAITYAECAGLKMISWEYPREGNLYSLINETGLHPITCLTTLPKVKKRRLLESGVTLCRTIRQDQSVLKREGLSDKKIGQIIEESAALCQPGTGV